MKKRRESGGVMLEAILIMPIIIFATFAAVEFTRQLRFTKIALHLSKEAANVAFRECSDVKTLVATPCLPMLQDKLQKFARDHIVPGSDIAITVAVRSDNRYLFCTEPHVAPSCVTDPADLSSFTCADKLQSKVTSDRPSTLIDSQGVAVCARARIPYAPILGSVGRLFSFSVNRTEIENDTIL